MLDTDIGNGFERLFRIDSAGRVGGAIEDDGLGVPHADMQNRTFGLEPMVEIAPHKRHPVSGKTMQEMLSELLADLT